MACGNADLIAAISKVKENTDSGIFNPIQYAANRALRQEAGNWQSHPVGKGGVGVCVQSFSTAWRVFSTMSAGSS